MEALKSWRKSVGITQVELSKKIGFTQGYITDIERGRQLPSYAFLKSIKDNYPETDINIFFE